MTKSRWDQTMEWLGKASFGMTGKLGKDTGPSVSGKMELPGPQERIDAYRKVAIKQHQEQSEKMNMPNIDERRAAFQAKVYGQQKDAHPQPSLNTSTGEERWNSAMKWMGKK